MSGTVISQCKLSPHVFEESADELADNESLLAPFLREGIVGHADAPVFSFALRHCFGFPHFRPGQKEAIVNILSGISTLVVIPTGCGKSLCYVFTTLVHRLMYHSWRLTLVVSPLLSLMEDQMQSLKGNTCGLRCEALTSGLSSRQQSELLGRLKEGLIDILYVSPERVVSSHEFRVALQKISSHVGLLCVDEAHCICHWSHDFRPSYMYLRASLSELLRERMPPILALTATASRMVREELSRALNIKDVVCPLTMGVKFPVELRCTSVGVYNTDTSASHGKLYDELLRVVRTLPTPMLIYAASQAEADEVASYIRCHLRLDVDDFTVGTKRSRSSTLCSSVMSYHAGKPAGLRKSIQRQFLQNEIKILSATVAFGLGIDKKDIRSVVHVHVPPTVEEYVQQIGRVGRDGKSAFCHLLYCPRDYYRFRQRNMCNILSFPQVIGISRKLFTIPLQTPGTPSSNITLVFTTPIAAEWGCSTETVDTLLFVAAANHPDFLKILGTVPRRAKVLMSRHDAKKNVSSSFTSHELLAHFDVHDVVADFVRSHNEILDMLAVSQELSLSVEELYSRLKDLACNGRAKFRFSEQSFIVGFTCLPQFRESAHIELIAKELFHLQRSKIDSNDQKLRSAFACLANPNFDSLFSTMEDGAFTSPWYPPEPLLTKSQAVNIVNSFCWQTGAQKDAFVAAKVLCGLLQANRQHEGPLLMAKWRESPYFGKLLEYDFDWVMRACIAALHN